MKTRKFMALFLSVLLLATLLFSCAQTEQDQTFSEALHGDPSTVAESAPEESGETSGEITFVTMYKDETGYAQVLADAFNRTHPDSKVNVEGSINLSDLDGTEKAAEAESNFATRLATELMGGEADYILNDNGALDPTKYAATGLFFDIYEWMESDPDFKMDDYYKNVLEACTYDGHLYSMPTSFVISSVYLNKNIVDGLGQSFEPLDRINYEQLLQMEADAKAQGLMDADSPLEFAGTGTSTRFKFHATELPEYVDLSGGTVRFDSPEFISMLEKTKEAFAPKTPDTSLGMGLQAFSAAVSQNQDKSLFVGSTLSLAPGAAAPIDAAPDGLVGPLVLESTQGNVVYQQDLTLAVPKSCTQPELAWEFLKFCISAPETPGVYNLEGYEGVDVTLGKFPVNRQNLQTYAGLYKTFNEEESPLLEKLDGLLADVSISNGGMGSIEQIVTPIMLDYYERDLISAEDCAKQMQERAEVYLKE